MQEVEAKDSLDRGASEQFVPVADAVSDNMIKSGKMFILRNINNFNLVFFIISFTCTCMAELNSTEKVKCAREAENWTLYMYRVLETRIRYTIFIFGFKLYKCAYQYIVKCHLAIRCGHRLFVFIKLFT